MLPMKPDVCSLPNGRIALFLGADYKFLTHDEAIALRDALTAELADDWQPIETAPKDGTPVFIGRGGTDGYAHESRWVRCYMPDRGVARDDETRFAWFAYDDDGVFRGYYDNEAPTHWRAPITLPPEVVTLHD